MKVLFAAPEDAWGGIYARFRQALPKLELVAARDFHTPSLAGFDAIIPTMTRVDAALLQSADRLKQIQQVGAGLEGGVTDISAAGNIEAVCDNLRRLQQGAPLWHLA